MYKELRGALFERAKRDSGRVLALEFALCVQCSFATWSF